MSDHTPTPGPWKATWNAYRERWIVAAGDVEEGANYATGMSMNGTVVGNDGIGVEGGPNARLIAAAPDLLAVLEGQGHRRGAGVSGACLACDSLHDFETWPCPAAQAIAKAKGETP